MRSIIVRAAVVLVILVGGLAAQAAPLSSAQVAAQCREIVDDARRAGLLVGFSVATADDGLPLVEFDADQLMIPASNMKIVTVAAALLGLGPDHALLTDLIAHGTQRGGVLDGWLRLRGEGDPTLKARETLDLLAARVAEAGISRITGGILVDDRLFDQEWRGRSWPDDAPVEEYMAEVAALSLNHGTASVFLRSGGVGRPAFVRIEPECDAFDVQNRTLTVDARGTPAAGVSRSADQNALVVSGKIAAGTRDREIVVAIHDASMIFGGALSRRLRKDGVEIVSDARRPLAGEAPSGGELLVRIESKVRDVITVLMKQSQNHRAEMLWKHLGACLGGAGSFEGGGKAARTVLERAGVRLKGAVLADGSGLSRDDLVSPNDLVQTLRAVWTSPHRQLFVGSLPEGGESGATLRRRLKELGPRVHAKTGSLRAVSALSGFVETATGKSLAFSILVKTERSGKLTPHDVQDRLVRILARFRESA